MAHEATSTTGGWDSFFSNAQELVFDFAKAKLAAEIRPPAPNAAPLPAPRPQRTTTMPGAYYEANYSDEAQMLREIISSPRTWVGLAAIAVLVIVFVKMRR